MSRLSNPTISPVVVEDATLVAQILDGDDRAFASLYRRHARYIAGVIYRLAGNGADLDDVVQEAFCDAARALSTLREPSLFRPWIARIAIRRLHARLERRRRWRWLIGAAEKLAPVSSDLRAREPVDHLYEVLDMLPLKVRTPWVLHVVEGETLPEVARMCDVSLATAKRRIAEAQAQVDRRLHED